MIHLPFFSFGIDFQKRVLHFVWGDCSDYLGKNPDGKTGMDIYSARFCY